MEYVGNFVSTAHSVLAATADNSHNIHAHKSTPISHTISLCYYVCLCGENGSWCMKWSLKSSEI